MAFNLNRVIIAGKLGRDPESRSFQNGGKVVTFSVATSEHWTDKASGERKERTQWHRVAIFNDKLGEIAEKHLKKGSTVYLEGSIESRKYTAADGAEREITEIVLARFRGELQIVDNTPRPAQSPASSAPARATQSQAPARQAERDPLDIDDEIPF